MCPLLTFTNVKGCIIGWCLPEGLSLMRVKPAKKRNLRVLRSPQASIHSCFATPFRTSRQSLSANPADFLSSAPVNRVLHGVE